jgi:hypothetical protein
VDSRCRPTNQYSRVFCVFLVLLTCVCLAGCVTVLDEEVTLYKDGSWKYRSTVAGPVEPGQSDNLPELEQKLNEAAAMAEQYRIRLDWTKADSPQPDFAMYVISASGAALSSLYQMGDYSAETVTRDDKQAVSLTIGPSTLGVANHRLTVHGSAILESNGQEDGKGGVSWENTGQTMRVVLQPKPSGVGLAQIMAILAVASALFGLLLFLRSRQQLTAVVVSPPASGYCPFCGKPLVANMPFCGQCGRAVPPRQG